MHSPAGLRPFVASTLLIAIAYGSAFLPGGAPPWAPLLLAVGAVGTMFSAMMLGATRPGRGIGVLGAVIAIGFLLVAGGFVAALLLSPDTMDAPLWLGLPRRAAILIYGVGLLPVVLLPIAYAATFDRATMSEGDLAHFRERLAAQRGVDGTPREEALR